MLEKNWKNKMIELPEILDIPEKLIPVITNINNHNYFLIEGGRGGGKSQSIARIILWLAEQRKVRVGGEQFVQPNLDKCLVQT